MTYQEAVEYLYQIPKFTAKNPLEHTRELISRIGHPERKCKVIHVAGTNGKGSVCAFLSSILTGAGKRTGLFTSPHLVRINERFQINNVPASDEVFLEAFHEIMDIVQGMQEDGFAHPTYFEMLYAIGLRIFQKEKAEYLILETGLGGRLDATNTVEKPLLTVITSISLDHTEILGDTIEAIASEKAGIIKEGVPVVFDAEQPEAAEVILRTAGEKHAAAFPVHSGSIEITGKSEEELQFILHIDEKKNGTGSDDSRVYRKDKIKDQNNDVFNEREPVQITVSFPAEYQAKNASLAWTAAALLEDLKEFPAEERLQAVKQARWPGRMERILPHVILDGGHNEDGIREFVRTMKDYASRYRITLLFSAVMEKNYEKMICSLCKSNCISRVVVTEIPGKRNVSCKKLKELFLKYRTDEEMQILAVQEIPEAFETACEEKEGELLFCAGSLYLVGAVREYLQKKSRF